MGLKSLKSKHEAPTAITVALERVEHEHRAVVAYGPDTVSHGPTGFSSLATCPIYLSFKILDACTQRVHARHEQRDQATIVKCLVILALVPP